MTATAATTTLLDEVLPDYDFRSRHDRHVLASPGKVAEAAERYQFDRDASPFVRLLFRLRGLKIPSGSPREALTELGFGVLAERPGREIVAGTIGRFWTLHERDNLETPRDLEDFNAFSPPGWAKGVISLRVESREDGTSTLVTETRVLCVDERARRRFVAYWALIGAFSGWIRRDLLAGIARIAEQDTR
ncbi:MAG TPA: hypothetical protein VG602_02575 [Actinomycetota bacterium]|nr:hypothetical protein [Actinomycetota bacterium]